MCDTPSGTYEGVTYSPTVRIIGGDLRPGGRVQVAGSGWRPGNPAGVSVRWNDAGFLPAPDPTSGVLSGSPLAIDAAGNLSGTVTLPTQASVDFVLDNVAAADRTWLRFLSSDPAISLHLDLQWATGGGGAPTTTTAGEVAPPPAAEPAPPLESVPAPSGAGTSDGGGSAPADLTPDPAADPSIGAAVDPTTGGGVSGAATAVAGEAGDSEAGPASVTGGGSSSWNLAVAAAVVVLSGLALAGGSLLRRGRLRGKS